MERKRVMKTAWVPVLPTFAKEFIDLLEQKSDSCESTPSAASAVTVERRMRNTKTMTGGIVLCGPSTYYCGGLCLTMARPLGILWQAQKVGKIEQPTNNQNHHAGRKAIM
jgi:hypothetical protein